MPCRKDIGSCWPIRIRYVAAVSLSCATALFFCRENISCWSDTSLFDPEGGVIIIGSICWNVECGADPNVGDTELNDIEVNDLRQTRNWTCLSGASPI